MSGDKSWFDSLIQWGPTFAPVLKIGGTGVLAGAVLTNYRIRSAIRGLRLRWRNDCSHPHFTTRQLEVDRVKQCLKHGLDFDQYLQVVGPSGVGKTSVIQTAVKSRAGSFCVLTLHLFFSRCNILPCSRRNE